MLHDYTTVYIDSHGVAVGYLSTLKESYLQQSSSYKGCGCNKGL